MQPKNVVIIITCVAIALCISLCALKYASLQYNALDLAIYSQMLWNTTHGEPLFSSIQQGNYFTDHVEPIVFALAGVYALLPSPLTLLVLQCIALFGSTLLVFAIAKRHLSPWQSVVFACAFAYNPIIWNMALFEFHALVFIVPALLWALYAFDTKRRTLFFVACLLMLLVREDAALAVFGLGLLAMLYRRPASWWIPCFGVSIAWFAGALALSSAAGSEGYKFSIYYGWLGESMADKLRTIFTHPLFVLRGLLNGSNLLLIVSLVLLFLGTFLFAPLAVIASLPVFAQLLFARFNPQLLFETHYLAGLLPFLLYASILGTKRILAHPSVAVQKATHQFGKITATILLIIIGYSFLFLGPIIGGSSELLKMDWNMIAQQKKLLAQIPAEAAVVASYKAQAWLANRHVVLSPNYIALGVKQYSTTQYLPQTLPDMLIIDLSDFTFIEYQYSDQEYYEDLMWKAPSNMRAFLSQYTPQSRVGTMIVCTKRTDGISAAALLASKATLEIAPNTNNPQSMTVIRAYIDPESALGNKLVLTVQVHKADVDASHQYALEIISATPSGKTTNVIPFGWNLYPVYSLTPNDIVTMAVPLDDDERPETVELMQRNGYASLNSLRSAENITTSLTPVGGVIPLYPEELQKKE